ncbi:MAG: ATP-binding protein [Clostridiales bacterium]|nr:ATP-binding protein [Clostridiales bacterium]
MNSPAITRIRSDLESRRARYLSRKAEKELLEEQLRATIARLEAAQNEARLLEAVHDLLHAASRVALEDARAQAETLLTEALDAVFGEGRLVARLTLEDRADRREARLLVGAPDQDGNIHFTDPMDSHGGGVVDVLSTAFRVLMLQVEGKPLPLLLDEPGKHVSGQYAPAFAAFLQAISETLSQQIIMVTHQEALAKAASRAWRVTYEAGKSEVSPA